MYIPSNHMGLWVQYIENAIKIHKIALIYIFVPLKIHIDVYWNILTYIIVSKFHWNLLQYHWNMLKHANIYFITYKYHKNKCHIEVNYTYIQLKCMEMHEKHDIVIFPKP
jgi:hypothetical protein